MSRVIARHYASSHQILLRVRQVIEIRNAIENLADGSFGFAVRAVFEVHIWNVLGGCDIRFVQSSHINVRGRS